MSESAGACPFVWPSSAIEAALLEAHHLAGRRILPRVSLAVDPLDWTIPIRAAPSGALLV